MSDTNVRAVGAQFLMLEDYVQEELDILLPFFELQVEYDTVAIALQTRLDEKEYKSREIAESFREFKREVRCILQATPPPL